MIALSPLSRIHVAVRPVDFRKGIRGLKQVCRSVLVSEPDSGALFVFRNRGMTSIKILAYDGQGFWLMMKRLSSGRFPRWPEGDGVESSLDHRQFHALVNASLDGPRFVEDWKRVS